MPPALKKSVSPCDRRGDAARQAVSRRAFLGLAVSAGLAAPGPLRAETRQEKGRRLVEESLQRLGGEAFLAVRTMVQSGRAYSFYQQNLRGLAVITIYNRYEPILGGEDPDWLPLSRREVYTEKGDYYTLFLNGKAWEVTYRGARPFLEDDLLRYRQSVRRDIFYIIRYRLDEPEMYFYHRGTEIVDNVPTDAVDIFDGDGEGITVFLRQSDHLPVYQVYLRRDPKTRIPYEEKSVFGKYREVDGVLIPWNIQRFRDDHKIFEMFGRRAQINGKVNAKAFDLDKRLPILPPSP